VTCTSAQALVRDGDFVILDFEGSRRPVGRSAAASKYSPLRDVAGVLQFFAYAEAVARQASNYTLLANS
jgi:predicted trehalose synthase